MQEGQNFAKAPISNTSEEGSKDWDQMSQDERNEFRKEIVKEIQKEVPGVIGIGKGEDGEAIYIKEGQKLPDGFLLIDSDEFAIKTLQGIHVLGKTIGHAIVDNAPGLLSALAKANPDKKDSN